MPAHGYERGFGTVQVRFRAAEERWKAEREAANNIAFVDQQNALSQVSEARRAARAAERQLRLERQRWDAEQAEKRLETARAVIVTRVA